MNASILGRFFWKEYRTQRSLWIAIVGLFSCFSVLIPALFGNGMRPETGALFASGLMASLLYTLASSSILFASENEQGTKPWLGVLPVPPLGLWISKLAWVISSTLAAIAVFWIVAHLFGRADSPISEFDKEGYVAAVAGYAVAILMILVCAMVASQLCGHVLKALGLAIVLLIGTLAGCNVLIEFVGLSGGMEFIVFTIAMLMMLVISIALNRRWLRESSFAWQWSIPLGRKLTLDRALALPLETSPLERSWRRQLWLEWRNARGWMLGIALTSVLLMAWISPGVEVRGQMVGFYFSIVACLVPLLCGVASCRGEQLHQRFLFQGNRGVSSGQLLWAKHLVWMSFAAILVFGMAWRCLTQINHVDVAALNRGIRPGGFSGVPGDTLLPVIQLVAVIALLTYTIGHFCSLLFSQPILGLCVAVLGTSIGVSLVLLGYSFDVPLFVLAMVPVAGLFFLSFYRGRDWIVARSDRKVWGRFLGWCALGLVTMWCLGTGWRVAEVAWAFRQPASELSELKFSYPAICLLLLISWAMVFAVWCTVRDRLNENTKKISTRRDRRFSFNRLLLGFVVCHNLLIVGFLYAEQTIRTSRQAEQNSSIPVFRDSELPVLDQYNAIADRVIDHGQMLVRYEQGIRDANRNTLYRFAEPHSDPQQLMSEIIAESQLVREVLWQPFRWANWGEVPGGGLKEWFQENEENLPQYLTASEENLRSLHRWLSADGELKFETSELKRYVPVIMLARMKALQLESEGRYEDAWKYHLANVRLLIRFATDAIPPRYYEANLLLSELIIREDLWRWQTLHDQTPESLQTAKKELAAEFANFPRLSASFRLAGRFMIEALTRQSSEDKNTLYFTFMSMGEHQRVVGLISDASERYAQLAESIERQTKYPDRLSEELSRWDLETLELAPQLSQTTPFLEQVPSDLWFAHPRLVQEGKGPITILSAQYRFLTTPLNAPSQKPTQETP
jgi:hypothetical protein